MKRSFALVLALVLVLSLAACSSSKPKETEAPAATAEVSAPATAEATSGEAVPVKMSYVTWIGCAPCLWRRKRVILKSTAWMSNSC